MVPPREVISKDEYYMGMAFTVSTRSKDPNTQVGAYIVSKNNEPLSSGYNGVPKKINDKDVDWSRPNKYNFVHHAEDNAIWHAREKNLDGATIYVTMFPCKSCMLDIVRSGIYRVVYFKDKSAHMLNEQEVEITKNIAKLANVELVEYTGTINWFNDFVKTLKDKKFID